MVSSMPKMTVLNRTIATTTGKLSILPNDLRSRAPCRTLGARARTTRAETIPTDITPAATWKSRR